MSAIELQNIAVAFRERGHDVQAVRGVSLTVEQGEVYGIVGFSGAGKSTLVRTINLLERPTSGHVLIDGVDITDAHRARLREIRKGIGVIFQGFNLVGNLTVGANIRFALKAGGWENVETGIVVPVSFCTSSVWMANSTATLPVFRADSSSA